MTGLYVCVSYVSPLSPLSSPCACMYGLWSWMDSLDPGSGFSDWGRHDPNREKPTPSKTRARARQGSMVLDGSYSRKIPFLVLNTFWGFGPRIAKYWERVSPNRYHYKDPKNACQYSAFFAWLWTQYFPLGFIVFYKGPRTFINVYTLASKKWPPNRLL